MATPESRHDQSVLEETVADKESSMFVITGQSKAATFPSESSNHEAFNAIGGVPETSEQGVAETSVIFEAEDQTNAAADESQTASVCSSHSGIRPEDAGNAAAAASSELNFVSTPASVDPPKNSCATTIVAPESYSPAGKNLIASIRLARLQPRPTVLSKTSDNGVTLPLLGNHTNSNSASLSATSQTVTPGSGFVCPTVSPNNAVLASDAMPFLSSNFASALPSSTFSIPPLPSYSFAHDRKMPNSFLPFVDRLPVCSITQQVGGGLIMPESASAQLSALHANQFGVAASPEIPATSTTNAKDPSIIRRVNEPLLTMQPFYVQSSSALSDRLNGNSSNHSSGSLLMPLSQPPCSSLYLPPFGSGLPPSAAFAASSHAQSSALAADLASEPFLQQVLYDANRNRPQDRWSFASPADKANILQLDLDQVQRRLNSLQAKYSDMLGKYERARAELEEKQEELHKANYELQSANAEIGGLESDRAFCSQQKTLMEQQIRELEMRLQCAEAETMNSHQRYQILLEDGFNQSAVLALDNYDSLRREKDRLRQELEVVESRYANAQEQISIYRDDVCLLKRQLDQETQEKHKLICQERASHQGLSDLFAELQKSHQEKELLARRLELVQQKLDESQFEVNRLMSLHTENELELRLLRHDHNAVLNDHSLMMSERDSVLKENERLTDTNKHLRDQTSAMEKELKALKTQVQREHNNNNGVVESPDYDYCNGNRVSSKSHQQRFHSSDELAGLSKADELATQLDATKADLEKLRSDRDWAIRERERIVAERDSLRVMADQLRKDRDDAISRLGNTLKDLDDAKRNRERMEFEMKEFREKLENQTSKENSTTSSRDQSSPSYSCDSAIDTDMAEWEIETLEIKMKAEHRSENLGIELGGGREHDNSLKEFIPIYVTAVQPGSKFDGHLRIFDCILQVNNIDVTNMARRSIMDILRNSTQCKMIVRRRRFVGMKLISVPLDLSSGKDLGLSFEDGVYVSKIKLSSPAAKAGIIAVGDRIAYVNNLPLNGMRSVEVRDLIRDCSSSGSLTLAVTRSPPVLSPGSGNGLMQFSAFDDSLRKRLGGVKQSGFKDVASQANANELSSLPKHLSSLYGSSTSNNNSGKKMESILDKIHDKLFDRNRDKKTSVKASASIPVDQFVRASSSRSWTQKPAFNSRPISLYSGVTPIPVLPTQYATPCQAIPEAEQEAVLAELDEAIQDEGGTLTPMDVKAFARLKQQQDAAAVEQSVSDGQKLAATGGTWPKYKAQQLSVFHEAEPTADDEEPLLANVATQSIRLQPKSKSRKPVSNIFSAFTTNASGTNSTSCSQQQGQKVYPSPHFPSPSRPGSVRANVRVLPVAASPTTSAPYASPKLRSYANATRPRDYAFVSGASQAVVSSPPITAIAANSSTPVHRPPPPFLPLRAPPLNDKNVRALPVSEPPFPVISGNFADGGSVRSTKGDSSSQRQPISRQLYENYEELHQQYLRQQQQQEQNFAASALVKQTTKTQVAHAKPTGCVMRALPDRAFDAYGSPPPYLAANLQSRLSPFPEDASSSSFSAANNGKSAPLPGGIQITRPSQGSTSSFSSSVGSSGSKESGIAQGRFTPSEFAAGLKHGQTRRIQFVKGSTHETLGITIDAGHKGKGIFVISVQPNSLAFRNGIVPGDQILEICGISFRQVNNRQTANRVLSGISMQEEITIDVQYNPDKYRDGDFASASNTPRASPCPYDKPIVSRHSSGNSASMQSTSSRERLLVLNNRVSVPRFVFVKKLCPDWGISLIGGNSRGIFVDVVKSNCCFSGPALQQGDHILEFNGVNMRRLTMEQAMEELQRPSDGEVAILAQYDPKQYELCKRSAIAGDALYVRCLFDRQVDSRDEISFRVGDILFVDNTAFNGQAGLWRVWLVDENGRHRSCGTAPSSRRLEDDFFLKRGGSEVSAGDACSESSGSRRGTLRRSLKFIRRSSRSSQHQRTPSRDSQENALDNSSVVTAAEDQIFYQRVERIDYSKKRPVLLLGPLSEYFAEKMQEDYPHIFKRCVAETVPSISESILEQGLKDGVYVDVRRREKLFEVTSVNCVCDIMEQGFHCIFEVGISALERLHRLQIYPIVIFIKFKQAKQIKEVKDAMKTNDHLVVNSKRAKELFEEATRIEHEYSHYFTDTIQIQSPNYGVKYICQQLSAIVEHEQKKTLWIVSKESI